MEAVDGINDEVARIFAAKEQRRQDLAHLPFPKKGARGDPTARDGRNHPAHARKDRAPVECERHEPKENIVDLQASLAQIVEIASNLKLARESNDIRDSRISTLFQNIVTPPPPRRNNRRHC